jgi:hypothetical protein
MEYFDIERKQLINRDKAKLLISIGYKRVNHIIGTTISLEKYIHDIVFRREINSQVLFQKNVRKVSTDSIREELMDMTISEILDKRLVSKEWKQIIDENSFWCRLLDRDYPEYDHQKTDCLNSYKKISSPVNIYIVLLQQTIFVYHSFEDALKFYNTYNETYINSVLGSMKLGDTTSNIRIYSSTELVLNNQYSHISKYPIIKHGKIDGHPYTKKVLKRAEYRHPINTISTSIKEVYMIKFKNKVWIFDNIDSMINEDQVQKNIYGSNFSAEYTSHSININSIDIFMSINSLKYYINSNKK